MSRKSSATTTSAAGATWSAPISASTSPTRSTSASPAPSGGGLDGDRFAWSAGPSLGFTPFKNGWLSVGWNVAGFHDRDFEDARYTRSGPYVTMRLKFDQLSLQWLGLGSR